MWGGKRLVVVGVVLSSFAGCRCQKPNANVTLADAGRGGDARADAARADAGAPAPVLLLNHETIEHASWTASGAVVAFSRGRFWWFRPDGGGAAQTTPVTGEGFSHYAVAKGADVTVVTVGGKAHVFRGPKEVSSFVVDKDEAKALSDDGTLLATERMSSSSRTGSTLRGRVYDVATGKSLSEHDYVPVMSPNGEWSLARESIRSTRTGEEILKLPQKTYAGLDPNPWFGGRAVVWGPSGLVIADPKARSVVTVPAECKAGEIEELTETVDPATNQAVRFCGRRVLIVRVAENPPVVIEVPIPAARGAAKPLSLAFAHDDGAPLLEWGFPKGAEMDRVDLAARSLVKTPRGAERPRGRVTDEGGAPSADGRYRLHADGFLGNYGAVTVKDASGNEVVRFGFSPSGLGLGATAPFLHEHGLDLIVGEGAKRRRLRLGPDAPPLDPLPPLHPDGIACEGKENEMMPMAPQRTLTGGASIFEWPMGGSCVCVPGGCADPKLPRGVLARRDDKLIVSEVMASTVTYFEQRKEMGSASLGAEIRGATFLDDGASAALLVFDRAEDTWDVREVKLPTFDYVGERVAVEHPTFFGWAYSLSGTKDSTVVLLADRSQLKGSVIPRVRDGGVAGPLTRIDAWDDSAVVMLPDGRVELYGPKAEHALACIDGLGVATPFATCRARFEAKGAFRIE